MLLFCVKTNMKESHIFELACLMKKKKRKRRRKRSLVPGLCRFRLHKECGGTGTFSRMHDIKGRKDLIEGEHTAAQNSKKS